MSPDRPDAETLKSIHAYWRKQNSRFYLAATALMAVGFWAVWLWTGNRGYLYSAFFFPLIPLCGYFYWCFYLLNNRRDPYETQSKIEKLANLQQRDAKVVVQVNGPIVVAFLIFVAAVGGLELLGRRGAELGVAIVLGLVGLALALIFWGVRANPANRSNSTR